MTLRERILKALDVYCEATGNAPSTVATKVRNDGKFFDKIISGQGNGCSIDTYDEVMEWFKRNTPAIKRNKPKRPKK